MIHVEALNAWLALVVMPLVAFITFIELLVEQFEGEHSIQKLLLNHLEFAGSDPLQEFVEILDGEASLKQWR